MYPSKASVLLTLAAGLVDSVALDAYVFEPRDESGKAENLVIDRADGDLRLETSVPAAAAKGKTLDVWGASHVCMCLWTDDGEDRG